MNGAGSTGFGLEFSNFYNFVKGILSALRSPGIHLLGHWRRWSDRINTAELSHRIRVMSSGGISIHGLESLRFFCHVE